MLLHDRVPGLARLGTHQDLGDTVNQAEQAEQQREGSRADAGAGAFARWSRWTAPNSHARWRHTLHPVALPRKSKPTIGSTLAVSARGRQRQTAQRLLF